MAIAPVLARLRASHERALADLMEFARIPSVSTDPAHAGDVSAAARWVAAALDAAGPFAVRTMATHREIRSCTPSGEVHPASERCSCTATTMSSRPTLNEDKWVSPPWVPTVRDGRLYARGVSDDKGPMLIPIAVAAAF